MRWLLQFRTDKIENHFEKKKQNVSTAINLVHAKIVIVR